MKIILMRHGIAEERLTGGITSDAQRPLTPEGLDETRKIGHGLKKFGVDLDMVICSPLVRAKQTAEIVHDVLGVKRAIKVTDNLSPGVSVAKLYKAIKEDADYKSLHQILLVGHEPDMGMIATSLLGMDMSVEIPFKKAGVMRVDVFDLPPSSPGTLKWFLTPKAAVLMGSR